MRVGIEALNIYGGPAVIDTAAIFEGRGLDKDRMANLMMAQKAVALPCEDPVTNGVNAAKPIVDQLSEEARGRIEMVLACSESGIDFGKAMGTYMHHYLGLSRECRIFEIKHACYGGTAGLQTAAAFVRSGASPGAKVLVIATDVARGLGELHYAEPSQGHGAAAMLVSDEPHVLELDFGASGYHAYEVMDTYRPRPDLETGDPDLSLLSYLDCLENAYAAYARKVADVHLGWTFDYLAFHTPFGGMVKGAHRKLLRGVLRAKPADIEADFQRRMLPSLHYCVRVGNVYSATLYFALSGVVASAPLQGEARVGLFSYGSGCSSEFFSGLITPASQEALRRLDIDGKLAARYPLDMATYDRLLQANNAHAFGEEHLVVDTAAFAQVYDHFFAGKGYLVLDRIEGYHRKYRWT